MSIIQANIKSVLIHHGINSVGNGLSTVTVDTDGNVLSVAPNGDLLTRPKGTAGPWESGRVSGSLIVYNTDAGPLVFALSQAV